VNVRDNHPRYPWGSFLHCFTPHLSAHEWPVKVLDKPFTPQGNLDLDDRLPEPCHIAVMRIVGVCYSQGKEG